MAEFAPEEVVSRGKHKPPAVITVEGERVRTLALPAPLLAKVSGIKAEAGILAPGRTPARLQLRDSAGLAPDFPRFSLIPSDEALCCAIHLRARYHPATGTARRGVGSRESEGGSETASRQDGSRQS